MPPVTHVTVPETLAMSIALLAYAAFADKVRLYVEQMSCRMDVYQAGYERGLAEGHAAGYAEGRRVAKPVVVPEIRLGP